MRTDVHCSINMFGESRIPSIHSIWFCSLYQQRIERVSINYQPSSNKNEHKPVRVVHSSVLFSSLSKRCIVIQKSQVEVFLSTQIRSVCCADWKWCERLSSHVQHSCLSILECLFQHASRHYLSQSDCWEALQTWSWINGSNHQLNLSFFFCYRRPALSREL